jgi:hypothetical protein
VYRDLDETISKISQICGVTFQKKMVNLSMRVDISPANQLSLPSLVAKAAKMLRDHTKSIVLMGSSEKQKIFYQELSRSETLRKEATALGIKIIWEKGNRGEIFGSRFHQGQIMNSIAGLYDDFERRYLTISLPTAENNLLLRGTVGDKKFQELCTLWKGTCTLAYRYFQSEIHMYIKKDAPAETAKTVRNQLQELLSSLGGSELATSQICVYCHKPSISTHELTICGHSSCKRCLEEKSQEMSPLTCGECSSLIHFKDVKGIMSPDQFSDVCLLQLRRDISLNPQKYTIRVCPNQVCGGLLPNLNTLQVCAHCGLHVCVNCGVNVGGAATHGHSGRSCQEYSNWLDSLGNVSQRLMEICLGARQFVSDNWPVNLGPISRIDDNPGLVGGGRAIIKFFNSLEYNSQLDLQRGFYCWHGTSEAAIGPICDEGFDPKRRSGQAHGPGEYFGVDANVSLGYARGSKRLIIAYVLQGSFVKQVQNFCYVVNNPIDWKTAYCVPLLVVSFGSTALAPPFIQPIQNPSTAPDDPSLYASFLNLSINETKILSEMQYCAPYRWHWMDDTRRMIPYRDEINSLLEGYYDSWSHGGQNHLVTTPDIIRYVDDKPQKYEINYQLNQQKNLKTGYIREIQRIKVEISRSQFAKWYVQNDTGGWGRYELLVEGEIENSYQQYCNGHGSVKKVIQFPGRPERYELDFLQGIQKNCVTNTSRMIRRSE